MASTLGVLTNALASGGEEPFSGRLIDGVWHSCCALSRTYEQLRRGTWHEIVRNAAIDPAVPRTSDRVRAPRGQPDHRPARRDRRDRRVVHPGRLPEPRPAGAPPAVELEGRRQGARWAPLARQPQRVLRRIPRRIPRRDRPPAQG